MGLTLAISAQDFLTAGPWLIRRRRRWTARLDAIGRQPFRARFHLRGRERALAESAGPVTMRRHAADLIGKRLAPASP